MVQAGEVLEVFALVVALAQNLLRELVSLFDVGKVQQEVLPESRNSSRALCCPKNLRF